MGVVAVSFRRDRLYRLPPAPPIMRSGLAPASRGGFETRPYISWPQGNFTEMTGMSALAGLGPHRLIVG